MHGRQPMLTGQAAPLLLGEPIDFDRSVKVCEQRAEVLKREMPLARGNLLAQQREQRRYKHAQKGGLPTAGEKVSG
jgi:hypothetical protein